MKLGYITDLFGKPVQDVTAPVDGLILYMTATPPVNQGEEIFSIGQIDAQPTN